MLMGFFLFGLTASPAKAGVVTLNGGTLRFVKSGDDPNRPVNVAFTHSGDVVTISSLGDALSYVPPASCTYVGSLFDVVACDLTGIDFLSATGGRGDDRITVESTLPATLEGGPGNDYLVGGGGEDYVDGEGGRDKLDGGPSADVVATRDGAPDAPLSCGPGRDFAIVDPPDPVMRSGNDRCERIDDGTQRKPRPGQVHLHPKRCGEPAEPPGDLTASKRDVELGLPAMHRLVPLRYSIILPSGYRGRPAPTLGAGPCAVRLTAPSGQRRSWSAVITGPPVAVGQTAGRRVFTTLTIKGPSCGMGARRAATAAPARGLHVRSGRGRGGPHVKGNYTNGAPYGTDWTTFDDCKETRTVVRHGQVRVVARETREEVIVVPERRRGHRRTRRRVFGGAHVITGQVSVGASHGAAVLRRPSR